MMAWEVAKVKGHDDIYKQLHHVYQVAEGKHGQCLVLRESRESREREREGEGGRGA